ncbi:hypothetical protein BJ165DRAFT_1009640 [Panaeolus papilionaceus]|nr:hypothetical protein BJ165DRAFT_1009640 [Panaeolus papilionaceus]
MKFSTNIILATLAATASAWEFTGWADVNYSGDLIIYRSGDGSVNDQCTNLVINNDRMSSFKWHRGSDNSCSMKLFEDSNCSGNVLGNSAEDWEVSAISSANNDKVSSLWVDCL